MAEKCYQCGSKMGGTDSWGHTLICTQCKTSNDLRKSIQNKESKGSSNDTDLFFPSIFFISFVIYSNRVLNYFFEINLIIKILIYTISLGVIIPIHTFLEEYFDDKFRYGKLFYCIFLIILMLLWTY
ncbi:hypothetical protein N9523_00375 [Flavobacteriaceae bacterium]|nr:hypothetical protein [Flavobacteriaceae bacterium]